MSFVDLDPSLQMNARSLAELLVWSTTRGLVTGPVDLSRAIDESYVQYALGRLGSQP
jgi:hypothetical protein